MLHTNPDTLVRESFLARINRESAERWERLARDYRQFSHDTYRVVEADACEAKARSCWAAYEAEMRTP